MTERLHLTLMGPFQPMTEPLVMYQILYGILVRFWDPFLCFSIFLWFVLAFFSARNFCSGWGAGQRLIVFKTNFTSRYAICVISP